MFSLLLSCPPAAEDELVAELYDAGTTGIAEEPGGLRAFFPDDACAPALLERLAPFQPELRREEQTDWEQSTRDSWPSLPVGDRFWLAPSWNTDPTPPGRIRLDFQPGMACGTGWHPCTQLCLEAMERAVRPGMTVLDVGSGSGILSAAAMLLGAARVIACDIDLDAILVAREHIHVPMFAGSADAVRPSFADIIVANISATAAEELAPEFARVARPSATVILSGFEEDDLPACPAPRDLLRRDGWACVIL